MVWDCKERDTTERLNTLTILFKASQVALVVKNLPADSGDTCLMPGSGISSVRGNGNPPRYSYLENPMERGAW